MSGLAGKWGAQTRPRLPADPGQWICCGPSGRLLKVVGLRCSRKMLKNMREFYNILKIDLKVDF